MKASVPPRPRANSSSACKLRLEGVDHVARRVAPGLLGDLDDAGGTRDVDLGEVVADHVEAREDDARLDELDPHRGGDLAVPGRERLRHATPPGREVAAGLPRLRNAREAMVERLAGDHQHAL